MFLPQLFPQISEGLFDWSVARLGEGSAEMAKSKPELLTRGLEGRGASASTWLRGGLFPSTFDYYKLTHISTSGATS